MLGRDGDLPGLGFAQCVGSNEGLGSRGQGFVGVIFCGGSAMYCFGCDHPDAPQRSRSAENRNPWTSARLWCTAMDIAVSSPGRA